MKKSDIFITCTENVKERVIEIFQDFCPFDYEKKRNCDGIMCEDCINGTNIHWITENEYED